MKYRTQILRAVVTALCLLAAASTPALSQQKYISEHLEAETFRGVNTPGGWDVEYNTPDNRSGGMMAWIRQKDIVTGKHTLITRKLKSTLPPGKYRVFIRVFQGQYKIDDKESSLEVQLGDAPPQILKWRDSKRNRWQPALTFKIDKPTNIISLRALHAATAGVGDDSDPEKTVPKVMVDNLIVTNDPRWTVVEQGGGYNTITNPDQLEEGVPAAPRAGNYFENASFELMRSHGWGKTGEGVAWFRWKEMFDTTTAADGKVSLKLPLDGRHRFQSKAYRIPSNRSYTLSLYMKASKPTNIAYALHSNNDAIGRTYSPQGGGTAAVDTEWKRFSTQIPVGEMMADLGYIIVEVPKVEGGAFLWVDGVQLEEGALTDFKTREAVGVGVTADVPGNIFYNTQPVSVDLRVYNPQLRQEALPIRYEVQNYRNETVEEGEVSIPLNGRANIAQPLVLKTRGTGLFRIITRTAGNESPDEMVYSVLPPNQHLNVKYPEGRLGVDSGIDPAELEVLKRANFNWVISKFLGRWGNIEPAKGKFNWPDEQIQQAEDAHINLLVQPLFISWQTPDQVTGLMPEPLQPWDPAKKAEYLKHWGEFVYALVNRYKGQVKHWEMENEPYYTWTAEDYADVLTTAVQAARRADPDAYIVGMSTQYADYVDRVFQKVGKDSVDAVSGHFYNNELSGMRAFSETIAKWGKKNRGWNTETTARDVSFYLSSLSPAQISAGETWPRLVRDYSLGDGAVFATKNFLLSNSVMGGEKYFFYFSRGGANASPTSVNPSSTNLEYDGGLRMGAVGQSIASHFIDATTFDRELMKDERVQMMLFNRNDGKGTVGVFWAKAKQPLTINTPALVPTTKFFGMMGNEIKASEAGAVRFDHTPHYFRSSLPMKEVVEHLGAARYEAELTLTPRLHFSDNGQQAAIRVTVTNSSNAERPVKLEFREYFMDFFDGAPVADLGVLKPGETRQVDFPLLAPLPRTPILVTASGGPVDVEATGVLSLARAIPRRDAAMGEEFWRGAPEILVANFLPNARYGQEIFREGAGNHFNDADLTGRFYAAWDKDNLYLAGRVQDEVTKTSKAIETNKRDQIIFSLDPNQVKGTTGNPLFQVTVAPGEGANGLAQVESKGVVTPLQAINRVGKGEYFFQVTVPWKSVGGMPAAGTTMGLDIAMLDSDGPEDPVDTEMVWAGGDYARSNPAGLGQILLIP